MFLLFVNKSIFFNLSCHGINFLSKLHILVLSVVVVLSLLSHKLFSELHLLYPLHLLIVRLPLLFFTLGLTFVCNSVFLHQ